jgi:hypothetical protein
MIWNHWLRVPIRSPCSPFLCCTHLQPVSMLYAPAAHFYAVRTCSPFLCCTHLQPVSMLYAPAAHFYAVRTCSLGMRVSTHSSSCTPDPSHRSLSWNSSFSCRSSRKPRYTPAGKCTFVCVVCVREWEQVCVCVCERECVCECAYRGVCAWMCVCLRACMCAFTRVYPCNQVCVCCSNLQGRPEELTHPASSAPNCPVRFSDHACDTPSSQACLIHRWPALVGKLQSSGADLGNPFMSTRALCTQ